MALEFMFACPLAGGLHARPASLLADTANAFSCECTLTNVRRGDSVNLKSTLAIIGADVRMGDSCGVTCNGPDEIGALSALRRVVDQQLPSVDDAPAAALKSDSQLPRALSEQ